jgi:hypothetical protein
MIRYVLLVVDLSKAAAVMDMRPSRLATMTGAARAFIRAFFDQNPLSQLGVVVTRNGVAQRLTELSGSPESQIAQLNAAMATGGFFFGGGRGLLAWLSCFGGPLYGACTMVGNVTRPFPPHTHTHTHAPHQAATRPSKTPLSCASRPSAPSPPTATARWLR